MRKHIKNEDLNKVKKLDLLTYLMNYEPDELVKISRNVYSTKTHGSLKISNGMWTWWAKNIGGKSALDYLIKVNGYEFLEAALYLRDCIDKKKPVLTSLVTMKNTHNYTFKLPTPNSNNDKVIQYLCDERCIDIEIVKYCIKHYNLYESKDDHAVIFVGYDTESKARYASKRSTSGDEKRDIAGSDKRFGFAISNSTDTKDLHIFEGAIDLLSYITILKKRNIDWQSSNYLSLGNASLLGKGGSSITIPVALEEYLSHKASIKNLYLHLDNDQAGHDTTEKIKLLLNDKYTVHDKTPKGCNDINQFLQQQVYKKKFSNYFIER